MSDIDTTRQAWQRDEELAEAVLPLLSETPERVRQVAAFLRLQGEMTLEGSEAPSAKAARIVLDVAGVSKPN